MKIESVMKIAAGLYAVIFLAAGFLLFYVLTGAYSNPWQGEAPNKIMKLLFYALLWPLAIYDPETNYEFEGRLVACVIWLLFLPIPLALLLSKFFVWMDKSNPSGNSKSNQSE